MAAYTKISKKQLKNLPEVPWTRSWHPIPHISVVDQLDRQLDICGMEIRKQHITVSRGGNRMFGTYTLNQINGDGACVQIGFRNSTGKQFALGFAAGTYVMVCSNMQISGDYLNFMRHTGLLNEESLVHFVQDSTKEIIGRSEKLWDWQKNLRKFPVSNTELKVIAYDMVEKNVIPGGKILAFADCVKEENEIEGEQSLYTVHGGVTRLNRKRNPDAIARVSEPLIKVCDNYVENMLLAA